MKKILLIISKDAIRRNILDTPFLDSLIKKIHKNDTQCTVVVEKEKIDFFKNKYSDRSINFVGYERASYNGWKLFVFFLIRNGIYSHSTKMYRMRAYESGGVSVFKMILKEILGCFLGRFSVYKKFLRFLVQKLHWGDISDIYDLEKPDCVFVPSLIDNDFDIPFAVEARRQKIKVIGMVRSWDNLNNHGLLAFIPDVFIAQNNWLLEVGYKFQAFPKKLKTHVVGLPHYDQYVDVDKFIYPKDVFFKKMGLDLNKKLILLGGSDFYYTEDKLPGTLDRLIEERKIKEPVQILFRPHPSTMFSREDYHINELKNVILNDAFRNKKIKFTDNEILINIFYYSDIIINIASTLSIDAAVFDTPAICIGFDDFNNKQKYWMSVERLYDSFDHYEKLVSTGGVRVPKSEDKLVDAINEYLSNPSVDHDGRTKILDIFVGKNDGNAGKRLADTVSRYCIF